MHDTGAALLLEWRGIDAMGFTILVVLPSGKTQDTDPSD